MLKAPTPRQRRRRAIGTSTARETSIEMQRIYEAEKRKLIEQGLTAEEYEAAIRALATRLGI